MEQKEMKTGALLKRFVPYYKKYVRIMVFDLLCASLTTVCELVLPLILRYITNQGLKDLASLTVQTIVGIGVLYFALRIVDGLASFYMAYTGHVMGAAIETDMRQDAFEHLQKLSDNYFNNTKVGQIMSRITSDLFDVTEFAHHCPEEFFIAFLKTAVSFVILAGINLPLTVIIFVFIPVMAVSCSYFNIQVKRAFKKQRNHIGELNARIEDSLLGNKVVRAFANEGVEIEKFNRDNQEFLNIKRQTYKYMAAFQNTIRMFDGLMYVVVIVAGGIFMIKGLIDPGDLVAYTMYVTTLLATIRRIIEFAEQFQRGMTGIERFTELMDASVDIFDEEGAVPLRDVHGSITFEHVSFEYPDDHNPVLSGIDLKIRPGEKVALVGPSGGGKTTLCNLIPRFYDADKGQVLVDGVDVRNHTLDGLRSKIGVVPQRPVLFKGTLRDNMKWGKKDASDEEIYDALNMAQAREFVNDKDQGLMLHIDQGGRNLSGGQRQRLTIARALVRRPEILIMDDSASALDFATDARLRKAIRQGTKDMTVFIVSQRATTIKQADLILVLDEGALAGMGTHRELLNSCEVYREICLSQLSREEVERDEQ